MWFIKKSVPLILTCLNIATAWKPHNITMSSWAKRDSTLEEH